MLRIRPVNVGLIAILAVAAFGSIAHAAALPLFSSADEIGHFDYAYQVWHGTLPDFYQGVVVDQVRGSRIPVQWTSQHPPLFYAILAPVVGPLTDASHILVAGMLARGVNIVIAVLATWAAFWAARQCYPRSEALALAVGLVCAAAPWLRGTAGAVYNDPLAVLICALLFGFTARMVRFGPSLRGWVIISLLSSAALLARLSLVVVVGACLATLTVWGALGQSAHRPLGRWGGLVGSAAAGTVALASSGWFYLRNLRLTGSVTGGHPDWSQAHLGRTTRSLAEVAFDADTWPRLIGLFGTQETGFLWAFIALVLAPGLIGSAFGLRAVVRGRTSPDGRAVTGLLALSLVLTTLMQLQYATGGGAVMPRYILPVVVPVGLLIGAGLTWTRSLALVALPLWSIGACVVMVLWWRTVPDFGADQFPTLPDLALACLAATIVATMVATVAIAHQRKLELEA